MNKPMRVQVTLNEEVLREVDALVGKRRRSEFISAAVAEKLRRERQMRAVREFAGDLEHVDIPGWETHESTVAGVRALRDADNQRLDRLWGDR